MRLGSGLRRCGTRTFTSSIFAAELGDLDLEVGLQQGGNLGLVFGAGFLQGGKHIPNVN